GRNDPCHCGSGRKYKKCHLEADERSRVTHRPARLDPALDRGSLDELLPFAQPGLDLEASSARIVAAEAAMEAHFSSFEALIEDDERFLALTQSLFEEECFAPLRFTASDVRSAFDHVGYPQTASPDDMTVDTLRAAILHVADKERRAMLAVGLLLHLPGFVADGRFLEAWLIRSMAEETVEEADESNGFLFQMFAFGYNDWAADKLAKDRAMLQQLGLDPERIQSMSLDEIDSWIREREGDPSKAGVLEAFFREHPDLREGSIANIQSMERNSVLLLEREDSRFLLLPFEEVEPWLIELGEQARQQGLLEGFPDDDATGETRHHEFNELHLPLLREMADSIFTGERVAGIIADLKKYRNERFAAGDKATASQALGAVFLLDRETSPGENYFLLNLCARSMYSMVHAEATDDQKRIN
ncbi:MAG TPA: SEC-C domain-containing protein, partial [Methylomirabilota bacterium]|nr:SEC-C domain-containing protein [Methylomirabilota bacterium]